MATLIDTESNLNLLDNFPATDGKLLLVNKSLVHNVLERYYRPCNDKSSTKDLHLTIIAVDIDNPDNYDGLVWDTNYGNNNYWHKLPDSSGNWIKPYYTLYLTTSIVYTSNDITNLLGMNINTASVERISKITYLMSTALCRVEVQIQKLNTSDKLSISNVFGYVPMQGPTKRLFREFFEKADFGLLVPTYKSDKLTIPRALTHFTSYDTNSKYRMLSENILYKALIIYGLYHNMAYKIIVGSYIKWVLTVDTSDLIYDLLKHNRGTHCVKSAGHKYLLDKNNKPMKLVMPQYHAGPFGLCGANMWNIFTEFDNLTIPEKWLSKKELRALDEKLDRTIEIYAAIASQGCDKIGDDLLINHIFTTDGTMRKINPWSKPYDIGKVVQVGPMGVSFFFVDSSACEE